MLRCYHPLSSLSPSLSSSPAAALPSSVAAAPSFLNFRHRRNSFQSLPALPRSKPELWLAQWPEPTPAAPPEDGPEGPIELPPSAPSILASNPESASPLQAASSILLTGAISVFLFRAIRRRAKRAKELRLRSSQGKKTVKEEALESLKAMTPAEVESKTPPSPVQALLGAVTAGVIALVLYKFTITVEAALNRQSVSDSYSVRQITITIRTIINGLCYLATFVFGINSIGLFLYSGQLAINSLLGGSSDNDQQQSSSDIVEKTSTYGDDPSNPKGAQNTDDRQ